MPTHETKYLIVISQLKKNGEMDSVSYFFTFLNWQDAWLDDDSFVTEKNYIFEFRFTGEVQ